MKFIYLSILPLILFYDANAQTANIANCGIQADEPPGCLLCDSILNFSNEIYTAGFPGDTYECGYIDNNYWISFMADGNIGKVYYIPYDCINLKGTQAIIYNRNFEPVSTCFSSFNITPEINFQPLQAGEIYYLMIDGLYGDICTDRFVFISGVMYPELGVAHLKANQVIPDTVCPAEILRLDFDTLPILNEIVVETANGQIIQKDSVGYSQTITFTKTGLDTIFYYAKTPCLIGTKTAIPIFVRPSFIEQVIDTAICTTTCITFRDSTFCQPGNHFYGSLSNEICDSIFIISINEKAPFRENYSSNICEGDSLIWRGEVFKQTGIFERITSDSLTGCDSIFQLNLIVRPPKTDFFVIRLMENDSFFGRVITGDTIIADTFQSIFGCDSIRRYSIKVEKSGLDTRNVGYPGLHLYPNPNNGNFILMWEQELTIEAQLSLYDSTGKLILKKGNIQVVTGENQQHLPPNLPPGLYQLLIKTNKGQGNYRIIIQP